MAAKAIAAHLGIFLAATHNYLAHPLVNKPPTHPTIPRTRWAVINKKCHLSTILHFFY